MLKIIIEIIKSKLQRICRKSKKIWEDKSKNEKQFADTLGWTTLLPKTSPELCFVCVFCFLLFSISFLVLLFVVFFLLNNLCYSYLVQSPSI